MYGQSLEKDIKGDTSGNFEDLLVELSKVSVKSSYRLTNDSGSEEIFWAGVSTWQFVHSGIAVLSSDQGQN